MRPTLGSDDVRVRYCLTTTLEDEAISEATSHLSVDERARCERFVFPHNRRDFAAAHALLRRTLSDAYPIAPHEWTFAVGPGGKPALTADLADVTRLSFNLTHADGLVACAVTCGADVGVDAEVIGRRLDAHALARSYFFASEVAYLERCTEAERQYRFIEIWTLKEAYLKATGTGLAQPLDTFGFTFEADGALRFEPPPDVEASNWRFALVAPSERSRIAIAVGARTPHHRRIDVRLDGLVDSSSSARNIYGDSAFSVCQ